MYSSRSKGCGETKRFNTTPRRGRNKGGAETEEESDDPRGWVQADRDPGWDYSFMVCKGNRPNGGRCRGIPKCSMVLMQVFCSASGWEYGDTYICIGCGVLD